LFSLGFITEPTHLVVVELALALMVLQAFVVNRLAGIDYPLWFPRAQDTLPLP
jgi:hypothetical protein